MTPLADEGGDHHEGGGGRGGAGRHGPEGGGLCGAQGWWMALAQHHGLLRGRGMY